MKRGLAYVLFLSMMIYVACASAVSCTDEVKNGAETDVDCGDGCAKCALGKLCIVNTDCASDVCTGPIGAPKTCAAPLATCGDGIKNQDETDVDCGGNNCRIRNKCALGKLCIVNTDCLSNNCTGLSVKTCKAGPTCNDGIKNGLETSVDCGGNICPKCGSGGVCISNADCLSNICTGISVKTCKNKTMMRNVWQKVKQFARFN
ncbi:MAG: hypothetical protein AABY09_03280 [Nanoarchaeota archaeon]